MLELYQAFTDYEGMIELAESMVSTAIEKVLGVTEREYEGTLIRLEAPWQRMTYRDALLEFGGAWRSCGARLKPRVAPTPRIFLVRS
jgi:lysyl-tRNA synthetase class 2